MLLLAAEPHSTTESLFSSQCPCETILLTLHSMEWDWWVTSCAQVAHRYTYARLRCRTSQYHRTFISLSVILLNGLADVRWSGTGRVSGAQIFMCLFIRLSCSIPFLSSAGFFLPLISDYRLVLWGWGLLSFPAFHSFFNNNKMETWSDLMCLRLRIHDHSSHVIVIME